MDCQLENMTDTYTQGTDIHGQQVKKRGKETRVEKDKCGQMQPHVFKNWLPFGMRITCIYQGIHAKGGLISDLWESKDF